MAETSPDFDVTHYLAVLLRRRWIVGSAWLIAVVSTILWVFTTRPVYQASALLIIEKERGTSAVSSDGTVVESTNDDYYQTQYKLLKSVSLLQQVYDRLGLDRTEDFAKPNGLKRFEAAVSVSPVLHSRLVYVRAESHDAALAARITNALAESFVQQNLANQLFISKEVLQALQVHQGDPGADRTYAALPAVVNNTLIQTLKAEYAKLQAQAADMASRYMPKHPTMLALRSNMAALEGQIRQETEKIVQSLKTELSGQLKGNNVRIIDPAVVPERPIRPRKTLSLALGALGGLAFGFLMALVVEVIDQSIRTQEDVESKLALPFLGLLPQASIPTASRVVDAMLSPELSLTSEAFRNLRTMVDFAEVSDKTKTLLMTSSVQEEGKSYVAANTAVAFSQLGERVLLVDGDLRRPTVHKKFSVAGEKGLSDFLALGHAIEELDGLVRDSGIPNLRLLACGTRPPNPSELLNTPRLGAVVAHLSSRFDRVIIDCTPTFPVSDTLLWGRHIKSAVMVVRYGMTRTPLVQKACRRLQGGGIRLLGIAVNGAKSGGMTYSQYGYTYQQYYQSYHEHSKPQRV